MVTLAFMEFTFILSSQLRSITGGDDGISFKLPGILAIDFSYGKILGVEFTGRLISYYLILILSLILFLLMLRFVHSPVGRVLQSIRDNEQRSIALGYRTYLFQVIASSFASCVAAVTGGCFAIWVCYVSPGFKFECPHYVRCTLDGHCGRNGNALWRNFWGSLLDGHPCLPSKVTGFDCLPSTRSPVRRETI